jgi:hypothetical protein
VSADGSNQGPRRNGQIDVDDSGTIRAVTIEHAELPEFSFEQRGA